MTSKGEKIGAALARAVKASTGITSASLGAKMFRTNIKDVPKVEGLKRDDGWIDMQVQFLIDKKSAGGAHGLGGAGVKPGRGPRKRRGRARAQAGREPRAAPAQKLRRVLHRVEGPGPHYHRQGPRAFG